MSRRVVMLSACALFSIATSAGAEPYHHGKTIKQCNEELLAGRPALTAAGESPAKFIHDCWWQTKAGQPTPIPGTRAQTPNETAAKLKTADEAIAKADAEADAAKAEAARAKQDASDARRAIEAAQATPAPGVAHPEVAQSHSARPGAQAERPRAPAATARTYVVRRHAHRPIFVPARIVGRVPSYAPRYRPSPLAADDRVRPEPAGRQEGEALVQVDWVPVHIATMPQPIRWPVFPEFVPSFRYAVNHPIVPGLTWTP